MKSLEYSVIIPAEHVSLPAVLDRPPKPRGIVVFARVNGGRGRANRMLAEKLNDAGFASLRFDLITPQEGCITDKRFDVDLLATRLIWATRWVKLQPELRCLPIGYFGTGTGAAASMMAAAFLTDEISAVVSCEGRPDLADKYLRRLSAPVMLIAGEKDAETARRNQDAAGIIAAPNRQSTVTGSAHLLEDTAGIGEVSRITADWFRRHLIPPIAGSGGSNPGHLRFRPTFHAVIGERINIRDRTPD